VDSLNLSLKELKIVTVKEQLPSLEITETTLEEISLA